MTNDVLLKDGSIDVESVKSHAMSSSSSSNGTLTCLATLKPPPCQLLSTTSNDNDDDATTTATTAATSITYEQQQPAWECSFSRDGTYLAVCYGAPNPCVRIYHYHYCQVNNINGTTTTTTTTAGGRNHHECESGPTHHRTSVAPTPLAVHDSNTTKYNYSWQLQSTLDGIQHRTIRSLHFAPTSRPLVLAAASFDGTICIWEQQQQQVVIAAASATTTNNNNNNNNNNVEWECTTELQGHENEVKCVRWNATGSLLATCGRDKSIWIWEAYLPGTIGGGPVVSSTTMGHKQFDTTTTTTPSAMTATSTFECISVLNGHEGDVKHVQFASSHDQFGDGPEILLSASYDETIRIWAEEDGDWYCALSIASVHTSTIWTLTVAPSATRFVSGSADQCLAIYKCFTSQELQERDITKPGQQLPVASRKKATWECVGTLPNAHSSTIYCVDYAPTRASHGRIVSCGADNRIQIYREVSDSKPEQPLFVMDAAVTVPTGGDVNFVQWHPFDGSVLASTSDDGSVRIWNYTM